MVLADAYAHLSVVQVDKSSFLSKATAYAHGYFPFEKRRALWACPSNIGFQATTTTDITLWAMQLSFQWFLGWSSIFFSG